MSLSLSSFFASSIAVTVLTIILLFFLKNNRYMSQFGLECMYLFALLILFRGLFPIELCFPFALTQTIYSEKLLPFLRDLLLKPLWEVQALSVTPAVLLIFIWLIGSLIMLGRKLREYLRIHRHAARFPQVSDPVVLSCFQEVWKHVFPTKETAFRLVRSEHTSSPANRTSKWGISLCLLLFILSFTFVFETSYSVAMDENGDKLFRSSQKDTFYIRNEGMYDLYIDNEYVYSSHEILETFNQIPIYDKTKEVLP